MRGRPSESGSAVGTFAAAASNALASIAGGSPTGTRTRGRSGSISGAGPSVPSPATKLDRQRAIRELVATGAIGSQGELVDRLTERGMAVTQATVSRDIAELGLVKVPRGGRPVYVAPESLGAGAGPAGAEGGAGAGGHASDERLRRILTDVPVTVGRSGLILLVTGTPGTASIIAQAIDESSLTEQEGTLAGDNTLLVLFSDEARLLAWRDRFDTIRTSNPSTNPRRSPASAARRA